MTLEQIRRWRTAHLAAETAEMALAAKWQSYFDGMGPQPTPDEIERVWSLREDATRCFAEAFGPR